MSAWHDIYTITPTEGQVILARRCLLDTDDVCGTYSHSANLLFCAADDAAAQLQLATADIWEWKPLATLPDPWPAPNPAKKGWQDVWGSPPADQQNCWIRRRFPQAAAIIALWDAPSCAFHPSDTTFDPLDWNVVWRWKPV